MKALLWGFELAALIEALVKLAIDLGLPPGGVKQLRGLLYALLTTFELLLPELEVAYPDLAKWGPIVLGAIVAYLIAAGYYQIQALIRRALTRVGRIMKAC